MKLSSRRYSRWFAAHVLLCAVACLPACAQRTVFAHYMLANQDYVSDDAGSEQVIPSYEREILQAQAIGIDGFALNAGGWLKEPRYIRHASEMFEAAYRLHSGFKLMFSADMCCSNDAADIEDMMRRFANNPRYADLYFKKGGKFVLTSFAGTKQGPAFWQLLRADLAHGLHRSLRDAPDALPSVSGVPSNAQLPIYLVPAFFWGGELPRAADIQSGLADYASVVDGAFYWGIAGVPGLSHPPNQIPSSQSYASALRRVGKLYMAPICFQFWGVNAGRYYEYSGYSGMRAMWMDAIKVSHPDWVEIITWNDFVEGTYISPIDDPAPYTGANDLGASVAPVSTLHLFHSHRGATALLGFFIQWYKTGREPAIRNDSVYWAYRSQLATPRQFTGPIKLYGPVADVVYVTANLTSPAVLHVSCGDHTTSIPLPSGSTDVQIPVAAGPAPHFELIRGQSRLAQANGDDSIVSTAPYPNLYYSTGVMQDRSLFTIILHCCNVF
jgi:glucan endo-1,3-alpha-glucosidase